MYVTGLYSNTITACPFNPISGNIDIRRGRVIFRADNGVLYGHCQDEEGCIWVANHGAARVWRVSPQGNVLAEIVLPTRCVTGVEFAGTQLFITTMVELEPDEYPWSIVHQGALFMVDVGVRGRLLKKMHLRNVS